MKHGLAIGIPLGLIAFYVASLASALWADEVTNATLGGNYALSLACAIVVAGGLALATVWRPSIVMVASAVMLLVAVAGFVVGPSTPIWVNPIPFDIVPVWFHGSLSPLVLALTFGMGLTSTGLTVIRNRMQNRTAGALESSVRNQS